MAVGSIVCYMWSWKNVVSFDMYMFAVAVGVVTLSTSKLLSLSQTGLVAGEGIGGVFQALLAVVGVDGSRKLDSDIHSNTKSIIVYGTVIGCPGFEFCG